MTPDQRAAIEAPPVGRLKIVAGAGSGKTEVLTRRVAALLEHGVAPRDLVAVTYTRKAAAEMKQRLVAKRGLSPRLFHEMQVNTFHGFLGRLLRRDPFAAGLDGSDATVTETARQLLLEEVRDAFEAAFAERLTGPDEGFDPPEAQALVREFPRALGQIRRFLLGPAEFQAEVRRAAAGRGTPLTSTEQRVLDWLHRFYAMYLTALQERHLMDFDEILLRGEALVREWQETGSGAGPRVFLIDEFQDNNREQLRIVERMLAGRDGHLTVVGDFRQSIYRFQGADVSTFVSFQGTREIVLRENFRSCREVVELANAAIASGLPDTLPADQLDQIAHLGPSTRPKPLACLLTPSENPRDQAAAVADLIRRLVAGGLWLDKAARPLTFGDVAIIVPSIKRLPASFEDSFLERGIPYQMTGGLGFYDRCEIAELVAFLRLLVNPYHDHSLVKILTGPLFGLTDAELAELALDEPAGGAARRRGRVTTITGGAGGVLPTAGGGKPDYEREPLWVRLERRRRRAPDRLPERAHRFARFFAELRTCSLTMGVLDLVYHLIEEAGFREYVAAQANDLRRRRLENNLAKFIAVVRGFEQSGVFTTLRDFLAWHDRVLGSDAEEEEAGLGLDERGAVKIMTIHKAKGLEFPLVILPDLKRHPYRAGSRIGFSREEGLLVRPAGPTTAHAPWQAFQQREKQAAEAEDRRKLYVAFTRAEEMLVVTGRERLANDPQEPLAFVRSWIEAHPTAGWVANLEDAPALAAAWLAAGARPEAVPTPPASPPPDLPALAEAIAAVRTFLERPTEAAGSAQGRDEVFSLSDLERYERCPRRYFFGRQHLAPLVSRDPAPREVAWFPPSGEGEQAAGGEEEAFLPTPPTVLGTSDGRPPPAGHPESDPGPRRPSMGESGALAGVPPLTPRPTGEANASSGSPALSRPPAEGSRPANEAHTPARSTPAGPVSREVAACVGNLVHQTLRLFHQATELAGRPSVADLLARLVPLHGELGRLAQPRAAALLAAYARSPLAAETAWLVEAEVNLRLVAPSGPFLVRGFVDRVDRDGPHTRIIDYKTHPFHPEAHAAYTRQMALYLAAARHGILGDRGTLSFPEACVAYLTPQGVDLRPVQPDTVAFETWAVTLVEAIRREKTWPAGPAAPCADCGFLVLCDRPGAAGNP